jgi:Rps23 Pro-64 3,4-dihydroxylase Tpa1-like proline 4-hydroxylase
MGVSLPQRRRDADRHPASARRFTIIGGYDMAYSIKKHEVDRLVSFTVALGWVLVDEVHEEKAVNVTLRREFSDELLRAAGEIDVRSSPQ